MSKGKFALGAFFGAVAGLAAGLLTAPKSGKETRADLKDAALKTKDSVVSEAEKAKDVATQKGQQVKQKAEEVVEDVTERAVDLRDRTEQAIEGAKKGFSTNPKKAKK